MDKALSSKVAMYGTMGMGAAFVVGGYRNNHKVIGTAGLAMIGAVGYRGAVAGMMGRAVKSGVNDAMGAASYYARAGINIARGNRMRRFIGGKGMP